MFKMVSYICVSRKHSTLIDHIYDYKLFIYTSPVNGCLSKKTFWNQYNV